jgi:hypothetical protein
MVFNKNGRHPMNRILLIAAAAASLFAATAAHAGPFILAGTDADDHGGVTGSANNTGWLFMQRALENIYGGVTTPFKQVTILGSTSGAETAANSAFDKSALFTAGWTRNYVSVANFGTFFGAGGNLSTGILMMDSGANIFGGVGGSDFIPYVTQIDHFLQAGGGLFSQANDFSWLTTLLTTVSVSPQNTGGIGTGISTTVAGAAAFPGLTNADLSSGPFHQKFTSTGGLTVLGVNSSNEAIIIGGATGSITVPGTVPEPTSLALVGLALAGVAVSIKRKRA